MDDDDDVIPHPVIVLVKSEPLEHESEEHAHQFVSVPSKESPALKEETQSNTDQELSRTAGVKTIDTSGIEEPTEIQPGDGLPAFVCEECENLVNICYNFKLQVEKSNLTLKKYYANQEEYLPLTKKDDATADTTAMNIAASSNHDSIECAVGVHLLAPLGVNNSSSDIKNTETHGVLVPKTKLEHSSDCETEYEETGNTSLSLDNQCHTPQYMKDYKSHINRSETHMKEKPYMCAYCGHSFRYMSSLTRHLLIHSGEKRYACDICNKAFTQEAHLKTHSILHTGEKPFHCNICLMEFSRKGNLKRHLQVHKGNKASVCYMKTHVADTILHCTRKNQNLLIDYNEDS